MEKRIMLIIPTLSNGGAERVVSNLSTSLSFNNDIKILVFDHQIDYPYKGDIIDLNVKNKKNISFFLYRQAAYMLDIIKIYRHTKKYKKLYGPNMSVSFLPLPNISNLLSRSNEKVIVSVRNYSSYLLNGLEGFVYKIVVKLFYNKADLIVAVSEGVKQDLITNFGIQPLKIKTIHNPYEIDNIGLLSKEKIDPYYNHLFDFPVVINVGSLTNQKGQAHLIRAFTKVQKEIDDAKLIILGKGDLRGPLEKLINSYKMSDKIFLIGFQRNPFKHIRKSSVFVLSSLYEGFPNALVESMACGVPVISTDCKSGPREILAPNTDINYQTNKIEYAPYGILTPVCKDFDTTEKLLTEQESMLADSIIKMLANNELNRKYGLLAKKRAKDFDVAEIIKQWEQIIEK